MAAWHAELSQKTRARQGLVFALGMHATSRCGPWSGNKEGEGSCALGQGHSGRAEENDNWTGRVPREKSRRAYVYCHMICVAKAASVVAARSRDSGQESGPNRFLQRAVQHSCLSMDCGPRRVVPAGAAGSMLGSPSA